jgi:integrase
MLAEDDPIRATFSPEDVRRLIDAADPDWRGVILFGFFSGASLSDITNLRWQQIDLEAGTMSYARRKSSVPVVMPLHEELLKWLTDQPATDDSDAFVFPELAGMRAGGRNGLSALFTDIMKKAGIDGRELAPEGEAGYTRKALSFHCLRHTCNSMMANAGVPVDLRMALVGQTRPATNEVYTHREIGTLRGAVELMPGLHGEPKSPKEKGRKPR